MYIHKLSSPDVYPAQLVLLFAIGKLGLKFTSSSLEPVGFSESGFALIVATAPKTTSNMDMFVVMMDSNENEF